MKGEIVNNNVRKPYTVIVKNGKGVDYMGIKRGFSEYLKNGKIVITFPRDQHEYMKYRIYDSDNGEVREYDFGKNYGMSVIPMKVKVWFGKSDHVIVGYQMRNDGSYYHEDYKCFRNGRNKKYERSLLCELQKLTKATKDGESVAYGWTLCDETKSFIEQEIREAVSGKYKFEILFDRI